MLEKRCSIYTDQYLNIHREPQGSLAHLEAWRRKGSDRGLRLYGWATGVMRWA